MGAISRWYAAHSRGVKIFVVLFLAVLVLLSFTLLIILFVEPASLLLDSLVHPAGDTSQSARLTPTVLVAVLSAVLTGATTALITRCVDESLWSALDVVGDQPRLSIGESRRLAGWSVSVASRVLYLGLGESLALRAAGLFLICFVAVSPVLLKGISQTTDSTVVLTYRARAANISPWAGFLDDVNTWYSSGTVRDLLGETAFLSSLRSLNPPAAEVCLDELCSVNARMAGFQATCTSTTLPNPDNIGGRPGRNGVLSRRFYSAHSDQVYVDLLRSDPATAANFTNMNPSAADGDLTILFGAYRANWAQQIEDKTIYTVDCIVRYGWVNVTQRGAEPPKIARETFHVAGRDELTPNISYLNRIYGLDLATSSAWQFIGGSYGANGERLVRYPLGVALLGWRQTADGPTVARRIEQAWDTNNIFAFGRMPDAADMTTATEIRTARYVYNRLVLLVLLVPVMAALLGLWGRVRIQGDHVMFGYDPVKITRCGPVYGIPPQMDEDDVDQLKIGRYGQTAVNEWGQEVRYYQFIASGVSQSTHSTNNYASHEQKY